MSLATFLKLSAIAVVALGWVAGRAVLAGPRRLGVEPRPRRVCVVAIGVDLGHHREVDAVVELVIAIVLNAGFVAVEFGFVANSTALMADARHNLSEVLGLVLSFGAAVLAGNSPSQRFTYGLRSPSILAAPANAPSAWLFASGSMGDLNLHVAGRTRHDRPRVQPPCRAASSPCEVTAPERACRASPGLARTAMDGLRAEGTVRAGFPVGVTLRRRAQSPSTLPEPPSARESEMRSDVSGCRS